MEAFTGMPDLMKFVLVELIPLVAGTSNSEASFVISCSHFYFLELLRRGLADLRTLGLCHGDLKPENILISVWTAYHPKPFPRFLICDFGLSYALPDGKISIDNSCRGTKHFRAPEIEESRYHDVASDLFSAGKVLLRIAGLPADEASYKAHDIALKQHLLTFPWILRLLDKDPRKRKFPTLDSQVGVSDDTLVRMFGTIASAVCSSGVM
jgi:serine/threonine protein kinase